MHFIRPSVAFSLALALAACAKADEHPVDSTSITTTSEPAAWTVTERGIGNLRAGMTVAEARAAVPAFSVAASRDSTACTYAKTNGLPPGVMVMVEGGKVVRVECIRPADTISLWFHHRARTPRTALFSRPMASVSLTTVPGSSPKSSTSKDAGEASQTG